MKILRIEAIFLPKLPLRIHFHKRVKRNVRGEIKKERSRVKAIDHVPLLPSFLGKKKRGKITPTEV